jgi:predicted dehydrogenase
VITIGQVGLGHWGPNLLRNFMSLPDSRVKLCCDVDEAARVRASDTYPDVETTADYDRVLEDEETEAVVVSSPASLHYEHARLAIEHGKHLFVEKPIALDITQAVELVRLAEARHRVLMVGHLLLYHPAVRQLKAYVDTGELGNIHYIYSHRLNLGKVRRDENAMWSLAPHDISVALFLLNQTPEAVSAQGRAFLRPGVHDLVFLTMYFADGSLAHCHVSWLDPHKVRRFTVVGSKKMAVFDDMESREKIRLYDAGVDFLEASPATIRDVGYADLLTLRFGDVYIPRVDMKEPLRLECQHFLDCIQHGTKPVSDGRNGVDVLRVLDAAQQSLEQDGQPVALAEVAI